MHCFANMLYEETATGITLRAMPVMIFVLAIFAIAYRYYSAFIAARVLALDDSRITPAHRLKDGKDYDPTNKWVLFGHHFAAISGAGPLIGPVLAIQFGYAPGLFWIVIGVVLAGAVQDLMVLAASVRCNGRSLSEIARHELGVWASGILTLATVVIVIIALAGLGFVVVKALGGDEVVMPQGTVITKGAEGEFFYHLLQNPNPADLRIYETVLLCPAGCKIQYPNVDHVVFRPEKFTILIPAGVANPRETVRLGEGCKELVKGSSWGVFTIAATIPIALFVGFYMYRLRPGKVLEASILGGILVIAATIAGAWIPGSFMERWFSLTKVQATWALCIYGFFASVLPVWVLLCPRDYISSFLKIGTILMLIIGLIVANPVMTHPPVNHVFQESGPTFDGSIFPFVFICIMCGAISGFHALVASGTTPKMINKESDIRTIGYGAMLMEGIVGVVALIAAATLPVPLYYDINVALSDAGRHQPALTKLYTELGLNQPAAKDPLHKTQVDSLQHLDLAQLEEMVGGETLRGRTGGAVTLAVSMALIFTKALEWTALPLQAIVKYWYHFAIMFEALFILTTIDAGTRIARFMVQEALGKVIPKFGETNWLPGAYIATLLVTLGWGALIYVGTIQTIWPMFGIANQLLAVAALAIITSMLMNQGKWRYAPLTLLPMLFISVTSMYAGGLMIKKFIYADNWVSIVLTFFLMVSIGLLLLIAMGRWMWVLTRKKEVV